MERLANQLQPRGPAHAGGRGTANGQAPGPSGLRMQEGEDSRQLIWAIMFITAPGLSSELTSHPEIQQR